MKPHLWFIHYIGLIVPRRLRGDWRQEWEAELRYREMLLAQWDWLDWRGKLDLLWRSTSAMLAVTDNGCGMNAETRKRIFEPFLTTKDVGKGTGLGLSTVYGIVKQHGGHIRVYSEVGKGTSFKIYFPRQSAVAAATGHTDGGKAMQRGSETILLAEDDDAVRAIAEAVLNKQGYHVLWASCLADAERLFAQAPTRISLLLTDFMMPGGTGSDLFTLLSARRPALKVLYMSGYAPASIRGTQLPPGTPFLPKPFAPEALVSKVREVLDSDSTVTE